MNCKIFRGSQRQYLKDFYQSGDVPTITIEPFVPNSGVEESVAIGLWALDQLNTAAGYLKLTPFIIEIEEGGLEEPVTLDFNEYLRFYQGERRRD